MLLRKGGYKGLEPGGLGVAKVVLQLTLGKHTLDLLPRSEYHAYCINFNYRARCTLRSPVVVSRVDRTEGRTRNKGSEAVSAVWSERHRPLFYNHGQWIESECAVTAPLRAPTPKAACHQPSRPQSHVPCHTANL